MERIWVNRLKPNHRGSELRQSQDQKRFANKKTSASGIFRELGLLLPGISEVTLAKLVDLMGKDGLRCLNSGNASMEFSVLIYNRYQEFLKQNNYIFSPTSEARREAVRRASPDKLSQEDNERLNKLLTIICEGLTKEKISELCKIIARDTLKIIWSKDALFSLKKFCVENQSLWLEDNGLNVLQMTEALSKKSSNVINIEKSPIQTKLKPKNKSKARRKAPQYGVK